MQVAGSRSWRLTFDVDQIAHLVLYARDTLAVRSETDVPRLLPRVRDRSVLIAGEDRAEAASAWSDWWDAVVTALSAEQMPPQPGLTGPLRQAVSEVQTDAFAWFEEHRESWIPAQHDAHGGWQIAKSAAEAAASDRGVSPGEVQAVTQLLLVGENWWHRPAPGVLLYSPSVQADETQLHELLRETFASSVV